MKRSMIHILAICCAVLLSGCSKGNRQPVSYENVDAVIAEAEQSYEGGSYADALKLYADAIKTNPLSVPAQLGAAKCQIALENYSMASVNLQAASRIDPLTPEIYDLYVELAEVSGSPGYARTAVNLAKTNHMDAFLERVPADPQLSLEEGSYDSRQDLTVTAEEGTEIMVTEHNGNTYLSYKYDGEPVRLLSGETTVTVYCTKDGIPSDEVTAVYKVEYEPTKVTFIDPVIEDAAREALDIESGPITDLDCESVTSLDCYFDYDLRQELGEDTHTITTLDDLKNFPKLQTIYFSDMTFSADLRELASCRLLDWISMSHCGIKDISFVESIPRLGGIDLSDNEELKDISPLAGCANLYRVALVGTAVKDLSPLYDKNISDLEIKLAGKKDLSVLENWRESLQYLELYNCGGMDLSSLGQYTEISSLYLHAGESYYSYDDDSKPLKELDFLKEMPNLKRLYVYGLKDTSATEIFKSLTNLTYLRFSMHDRDTVVPDELISELENSLPNCNVNYR